MDIRLNLSNAFNQNLNTVNGVDNPLDAALCYASAGILVLPKAKGRKDSGLDSWQHINCTDPVQIKRWYSTGRYDGVLLKPSTITLDDGQPTNLIWLDCDGQAVYDAVCHQFPMMSNTRTELTGSGNGYRVWILANKLPTLGSGKITRKGILGTNHLGFEIFFKSGAVVVSPSIHPETHNTYKLINDAPVLHVSDIDDIAEWALELPAKNDKKSHIRQNVRPISVGQGNVPADVSSAIERVLQIDGYKSDGWSEAIACLFHKHEHDTSDPAAAWNRQGNLFSCLKCGQSWNAKETAAAAGIEWPKLPPRQKRSVQRRESIALPQAAKLAPFTADRTFSSRYVNQAPPGVLDAACIAAKAPTGSGKSKWAAESTADAPSLLALAFRTAIVKSQADDYGAIAYDALDGKNSYLIKSAPRVSTTIDSLYKFEGRVFDTIIIDEWVSALGHFASAGTLKEKGAYTWDLLKRLITTANRVIVMDAHLTDDSLAELMAIRGDVVRIANTYIQPKVPTQILPNRLAFFSTALNRIEAATAPVLLGVTSPTEARLTRDLIADCYPDKRVRVVTVKQSHLNDTQAFIREINTRLSEVDVLIFNGAMSTGVDIQADVDSIICLIDRPLSPADGVQMLGRARNAQLRFARVPDTIEGLDCNAAAMFQTLEYAADLSHVETSGTVRSLARLRARHEARRNSEMANFLPMFRAYCHADGSDTQAAIVHFDKAIAEKLQAIRESHTTQKRSDTLAIERVKTITPDMLDAIRQAGMQEITPEIDAGYLRHKIEAATAQPINELLFDKYHSKAARAALYRASIASNPNASDIDNRENAESLPLHQRSNASGIKALFSDGLQTLGATTLDELPTAINEASAEAFEGFSAWAVQNIKRFEALLGYRGGNDGDLSDGVKAARYFLKRFGVSLTRKQLMRDGKRFMCYSVDAEAIAELTAILAKRRLKAAENSNEGHYYKTAIKPLLLFRSNAAKGTKPLPVLPKTGTGASKTNPFSSRQNAQLEAV